MKKKNIRASVFVDPTEIVSHLVGLKDVRVLSYARRGPTGELTIEQVVSDVRVSSLRRSRPGEGATDRRYTDLPFGGVPMTLRWKKHRMVCLNTRVRSRPSRSATTASPPRAAC